MKKKAILEGAYGLFDILTPAKKSRRYAHIYHPKSDKQALLSDWAVIGNDIKKVITKK